ncbi:MAG: hypothetical protein DI538_03620 [Azospira oryzae]|jgi:hypothetical protein|nr:MAG: hypothetical protein DI538_03620 [Azospira oryzae]
MPDFDLSTPSVWPPWRKILFRFFLIYLVLQLAPWAWQWMTVIPGLGYVYSYYDAADQWIVNSSNQYLFHIKEVLVPMGGSGDTSYGWAQLCTYFVLALAGCVIWTIADRRNSHYEKADYWLRTFVRYNIAGVCFSYGIIKLFALQMYFPNLSQLATPLGDYLPMRLSWMFIGYSTPYQVFSGAMEVIAGLLLLNRRTVTLGLFVAAGVFINIMLLNLSYDIPVKIFSMHMVLYCFFLLAHDARRLFQFFVLNKTAPPNTSYEITFSKTGMRVARIVSKVAFIILAVGLTFYNSYMSYSANAQVSDVGPIQSGIYDVKLFVLNKKDTIAPLASDTIHWKDVVFDKGGQGSVNSTDTLFRQRYRRGYFSYQPDTVNHTIGLKKFNSDSTYLLTMKYELPDEKTIRLWTKLRHDSVYVELVRSKRRFQLAERQFHWLSESNR